MPVPRRLILPSTLLLIAACAPSGEAGSCFAAKLDDLHPPIDFGSQQLVCSLDRIKPAARDKYRERHPELFAEDDHLS